MTNYHHQYSDSLCTVELTRVLRSAPCKSRTAGFVIVETRSIRGIERLSHARRVLLIVKILEYRVSVSDLPWSTATVYPGYVAHLRKYRIFDVGLEIQSRDQQRMRISSQLPDALILLRSKALDEMHSIVKVDSLHFLSARKCRFEHRLNQTLLCVAVVHQLDNFRSWPVLHFGGHWSGMIALERNSESDLRFQVEAGGLQRSSRWVHRICQRKHLVIGTSWQWTRKVIGYLSKISWKPPIRCVTEKVQVYPILPGYPSFCSRDFS